MKQTQLIIDFNVDAISEQAEELLFVESYYQTKGIKNKCPNVKYTTIENVLKDERDYDNYQLFIHEFTIMFIHKYGHIMNGMMGISLDDRQWEKMLYSYSHDLFFDMYYRYRKLLQIDSQKVFVNSTCKSWRYDKYAVANTRNTYKSAEKQVYLWSFVAGQLGIEVNERESVYDVKKRDSYLREVLLEIGRNPLFLFGGFWRVACRGFKKCEKAIHKTRTIDKKTEVILMDTLLGQEVEMSFSKASNGIIGIINISDIMHMNERIIESSFVNLEMRNRVFRQIFNLNDKFENMMYKFLIREFPVGYFEAVTHLYKKASSLIAKWKSVRKVYGAYPSIELWDMVNALLFMKNIKFCGIQHSGVYARNKYYALNECMVSDRFITWGYDFENYKFICMPEVRKVAISRLPKNAKFQISKFENDDKLENFRILYMPNFICFGNRGEGWDYSTYMSRQLLFFENLSYDIRSKITIRYDDRDILNCYLVSECREKYPELNYETRNEIRGGDSICKSDLIICDYYGSPHVEAMFLKKPFVLFDALKIVASVKSIEPYIEQLAENGFYFSDPIKFAEELSKSGFMKRFENSNAYVCINDYLHYCIGADEDIYNKWYSEFIGD